MSETAFFISDLHLGLESPQKEKIKERKLVEFLKFSNGKTDKLFIVGDLFDYWFEYKRVIQKGFFRTLTALQDLTESGVEVNYLIGNHDFLHRNFFSKEIGVNLYQTELTVEINGKKFFIAHGDGLVENDFGYKVLKKILRNKVTQRMYSMLHPDFGIWLASSTSKNSRSYTGQKDYGENDGLLKTARLKIDEGFDYVIFGHTHVKRFEGYKNGFYVNLGSWLENPCYGKFSDNKFEIINW